jgi:membrane peptidoglycan carboxypeptidase
VHTYFMALEQKTGQCRPAEIAGEMGLARGNGKALLAVPSFTLGTSEVTPLGMASAYGVFANNGVKCTPVVITRVTDRDGQDLRIPKGSCDEVMRARVAASVTVMLKGVIDGPLGGRTGQAMSLGRDAAGKTGTINGSAAVWFVGYTPDLAAAVVTYDPRGNFPMKNITIGGRYYEQVFGSTLPGPIWKQAMLAALEGTPETKFDLRPAGELAVRATAKPTPTVTATPSGSPTGGPSGSPAPSGDPSSTPKPSTSPSPKPTPTPSPS